MSPIINFSVPKDPARVIRRYDGRSMKPRPAPKVPGNTDAERMDAAVRMLFTASKTEFMKAEAKKTEEKRLARETKKRR